MSFRFQEEPGDYVVDGILMCGVCGRPKEEQYEGPDGPVMFPIIHEHQAAAGFFVHDETPAERAARIERNVARCWPRECKDAREAKLDDYQGDLDAKAECRAYVDDFAANRQVGRGLILYGRLGTGKTYLAGAICNELLPQGWQCRFTSLREIRQRAERWGGEREQVFQLVGCDLVVLDDVFRERKTDWGRELAFTVVDALWQARVPVIATTNMTGDTLRRPPDSDAAVVERLKHRAQRVEVAGLNMRMVTA